MSCQSSACQCIPRFKRALNMRLPCLTTFSRLCSWNGLLQKSDSKKEVANSTNHPNTQPRTPVEGSRWDKLVHMCNSRKARITLTTGRGAHTHIHVGSGIENAGVQELQCSLPRVRALDIWTKQLLRDPGPSLRTKMTLLWDLKSLGQGGVLLFT